MAFGIAAGASPARADRDSAMRAYQEGRYAHAAEELIPLAKAGDSEAQARLAVMYERGLGVAADPARARYWRRRAAISGSETDREDYWDGR